MIRTDPAQALGERYVELARDLREIVAEYEPKAAAIEQVFVNLLLNAVQAIEEKGIITATSRIDTSRKKALIEIGDTGSGIPAENLAKIFEPFYSTKPKGTGLGLAVAHGIVDAHGGTIESLPAPGGGALFRVQTRRSWP